MSTRADRGGVGGISVGGILVIIGIVLMIVWSFWIGLIILLIGLIAFGGFARLAPALLCRHRLHWRRQHGQRPHRRAAAPGLDP